MPEPSPTRFTRFAEAALLIATLFWGCGFTWAKAGGDALNAAAHLPSDSSHGPLVLLAVRFLIAGVIWLAVFPAARRGWTWASVRRSALLGSLLGAGLILQHLGLGRTTESVTAFLTSLTILFVPIFMTIGLRKPPPLRMWIGVFIATLGVALLTGAAPSGFGLGATLGLACALVFSAEIIVLNAVIPLDSVWRLTAGPFLFIGLASSVLALLADHGSATIGSLPAVILTRPILPNLLPLLFLTTLLAFGLMNRFQPRLDPTRAALIYLMEPVFAALYAFLAAAHPLNRAGLAGASLILGANALVEWLDSRAEQPSQPQTNASLAAVRHQSRS